ncbi:MAG: GIY-YIG nuclease family protein [Patescibacteria group bacterium]|jgi:putative endonuclease
MQYFTYVLYFESDGKFYIGYTSDLTNRLKEHKSRNVTATKHRGNFKLVYYECCVDGKDARKREKYFKTGFGRRFLNNRLENYFTS